MSGILQVDSVTKERQERASNPQNSAWVSANAGSGKTHVLAQRVKRLLLQGVPPDKILCLTYTTTAAANMANRILAELASWVDLSEDALRQTLAALDGRKDRQVSAKEMTLARRLFARALETPGGLKIQTIHAFCDAVLHQFPFEAGLAAKFQVLDDITKTQVITDWFQTALTAAAEAPLHMSLRAVLELRKPQALLEELQKYLGALKPFFGDSNRRDAIYRALGLASDMPLALLEAEILTKSHLPESEWQEAIIALRNYDANSKKGGTTERKLALKIERLLSRPQPVSAQAYLDVFLTKNKTLSVDIVTQGFDKSAAYFAEKLRAESLRFETLYPLYQQHRMAENSLHFITVAEALSDTLNSYKQRRGLLEFDEMIEKAGALLGGSGAPWVHYKLDQGVDHVLVDEAQDTSPAQWNVINALVDEFFAGMGARDVNRSVFAVGDDKQSIFSFQGAVPQRFESEKRAMARKVTRAGKNFEDVPLNLSFRSSPVLMKAVDDVFAQAAAAADVTGAATFPVHMAAKTYLPGRIDLWPIEKASTTETPDAFEHPFTAETALAPPRLRLARKLAAHIAEALKNDVVHDGGAQARRLRASDVLILVRSRGPLFDMLLRELKAHGVPVAGADRLVLNTHIAAMDLVALGQAMVLPEDDLNLASLLKSPLIGLDDTDLLALCPTRTSSLWAALGARAAENPLWQAAFQTLTAWRSRAALCKPYEFFARVLGEDRGRMKFYRRLGLEAAEVLDEFLDAALAFEQNTIPTLQNFISEFQKNKTEIKRQMEEAGETVRVMTTHGAKGLEAKWVILPDTVELPRSGLLPNVLKIDANGQNIAAWTPNKSWRVGEVMTSYNEASQLADAEYRRLLYVAMTRAEERLTICGAETKNAMKSASWYALMENALKPLATSQTGEGDDAVHHIAAGEYPPLQAQQLETQDTKAPPPAWLFERLAETPSFTGALAESADDLLSQEQEKQKLKSQLRGTLLHHLLERLPKLANEKREAREAAGNAYLKSQSDLFSDAERSALVDEALRVLSLPDISEFFGENSMAEVPLAFASADRFGETQILSRRIDRLVVNESDLWIIDFKSGHAAPPNATPHAYVMQLAEYRGALQQIYPDHTIHCAILWTSVPRFDRVATQTLEAALPQVA